MYVGKKSVGRKVFELINGLTIILLCIITIYPIIYVLACSLSSESMILRGEIGLLPKGLQFDAYKAVLDYPLIGKSYLNTLIYTVVGTLINMVMTILGAYPLSRSDLPGRKVFTIFIAFTMLFSGGLIPTYLLIRSLGMIDSFWVMIIPMAINTWNLIMLKTFFQNIPKSLIESATIDGGTELQILLKVVLPLSIPSIMTVALFYAVGHWNSYFQALIYLSTPEKFPLQIILREIVLANSLQGELASMGQGVNGIGESVKYATIIVAVVPILCVYPFIQKYFVKGVMIGSVKE